MNMLDLDEIEQTTKEILDGDLTIPFPELSFHKSLEIILQLTERLRSAEESLKHYEISIKQGLECAKNIAPAADHFAKYSKRDKK